MAIFTRSVKKNVIAHVKKRRNGQGCFLSQKISKSKKNTKTTKTSKQTKIAKTVTRPKTAETSKTPSLPKRPKRIPESRVAPLIKTVIGGFGVNRMKLYPVHGFDPVYECPYCLVRRCFASLTEPGWQDPACALCMDKLRIPPFKISVAQGRRMVEEKKQEIEAQTAQITERKSAYPLSPSLSVFSKSSEATVNERDLGAVLMAEREQIEDWAEGCPSEVRDQLEHLDRLYGEDRLGKIMDFDYSDDDGIGPLCDVSAGSVPSKKFPIEVTADGFACVKVDIRDVDNVDLGPYF